MSNYTTPRLVAKGDVVESTKAVIKGVGDPDNPELRGETPGSVGFQL